MSTLERAIAIAAEAHAGQVDKAGAPYVLHPLRMMLTLSSNAERIVAVLHDLVEDCPGWTFERLRSEGFCEEVVSALRSVTKRHDEDYEAFVRRAAENPIGRKVKLADLNDNCDLTRIAAPSERDVARIAKYRRAIELIGRLPSVG
jgi:(p)ppGpp synthase/HD superfamily hydrolase